MADWGSSIFSRADGTQETTIGNYGQKHNIMDGKTVGETRPQGNRGCQWHPCSRHYTARVPKKPFGQSCKQDGMYAGCPRTKIFMPSCIY